MLVTNVLVKCIMSLGDVQYRSPTLTIQELLLLGIYMNKYFTILVKHVELSTYFNKPITSTILYLHTYTICTPLKRGHTQWDISATTPPYSVQHTRMSPVHVVEQYGPVPRSLW